MKCESIWERASSKRADLLSQIPDCTLIQCLSDPLTQSWVSTDSTLTLSLIKTGDGSGTLSTDPHQYTIQNEGGTHGHPTLNNAHQSGGGGSGEGVNEGGAVGYLAGVAMANKHSRSQEGRG